MKKHYKTMTPDEARLWLTRKDKEGIDVWMVAPDEDVIEAVGQNLRDFGSDDEVFDGAFVEVDAVDHPTQCPLCKSEKILCEIDNAPDEKCGCLSCGAKWDAYYTAAGIDNLEDGDGNEVSLVARK